MRAKIGSLIIRQSQMSRKRLRSVVVSSSNTEQDSAADRDQGGAANQSAPPIKSEGVYEGDLLNGLRHGQGRFSVAYEKDRRFGYEYTGEWKDDKKHGEGTVRTNIVLVNVIFMTVCGVRECGMDGVLNYGTLKYGDNNVHNKGCVYTGEMKWAKGSSNPVGQGVMDPAQLMTNRDRKVSFSTRKWCQGKRDGFGVMKYAANGSEYIGTWRDNKQAK
eukprot:gene27576-34319_t